MMICVCWLTLRMFMFLHKVCPRCFHFNHIIKMNGWQCFSIPKGTNTWAPTLSVYLLLHVHLLLPLLPPLLLLPLLLPQILEVSPDQSGGSGFRVHGSLRVVDQDSGQDLDPTGQLAGAARGGPGVCLCCVVSSLCLCFVCLCVFSVVWFYSWACSQRSTHVAVCCLPAD